MRMQCAVGLRSVRGRLGGFGGLATVGDPQHSWTDDVISSSKSTVTGSEGGGGCYSASCEAVRAGVEAVKAPGALTCLARRACATSNY
jgi:hypothetical protein